MRNTKNISISVDIDVSKKLAELYRLKRIKKSTYVNDMLRRNFRLDGS